MAQPSTGVSVDGWADEIDREPHGGVCSAQAKVSIDVALLYVLQGEFGP